VQPEEELLCLNKPFCLSRLPFVKASPPIQSGQTHSADWGHGACEIQQPKDPAEERKRLARLYRKARRWKARNPKIMTQGALRVFEALCFDFANVYTGQLFPSHATIAKRCGLGITCVKEALMGGNRQSFPRRAIESVPEGRIYASAARQTLGTGLHRPARQASQSAPDSRHQGNRDETRRYYCRLRLHESQACGAPFRQRGSRNNEEERPCQKTSRKNSGFRRSQKNSSKNTVKSVSTE
jgi:hypothetical protein